MHSFTGEAASGRWSISQNRRYLWGCHFWCICDCSVIKQVLEYSGTITMVCRWAQELLGYQFTVVYRSNCMMIDVDSLTRRYGPLIAMHCMVARILRQRDFTLKPLAYGSSIFIHVLLPSCHSRHSHLISYQFFLLGSFFKLVRILT